MRMRAVASVASALVVGVLGVAACEGPDTTAAPSRAEGSQAVAGASPVATAPGQAPAAPAASPLGTGSAMTGGVSGLAGQITAFQVEETATTFVVDLAADVLFAFDSADLAPTAAEQLRKTVEVIQRGGAGAIQVIGHTDSQGTDAYNLDLSLRRARAVSTWLSTEGGVAADRLRSEGRGEAEPVAPNQTATGTDDPQGRAQNRRVQVIVPKP